MLRKKELVFFFKDALHDLRAQNPPTVFGKTGCEYLTQLLRLFAGLQGFFCHSPLVKHHFVDV